MTKVTIYTTPYCPYCMRAKALLTRKKVAFAEVDVSEDAARRESMRQRANGRNSVPQIFIGSAHIGGCDDVHALEQQGKLDALLAVS